ncbi:hypothetical protein BASA81_002401 [Batrachochytrium salamandrivorans]|nr:hypothetical protein BASA81_002401 [Batrachochytrium salamandrivorans]
MKRLFTTSTGASSFLLDISSEYINTKSLRNQSDLARALKSRFQSSSAFTAFESIDRALFLSTSDLVYREPYSNIPQPFGVGGQASMSTPIHHALVLDTLHVHCALKPGSRVLDVGCGSGYLAAALFKTVQGHGGQVLALDRVPDLVQLAKKCLGDCPITAHQSGLQVCDAYDQESGKWNLHAMQQHGPYDAIHVGFSFNPEQVNGNSGGLADVTMFCNLLDPHNPHARMLAGWGNDLCLFDSKGYRKEIATLPGLARKEEGRYVKPLSRQEKLSAAKAELDQWKQQFERTHHRKPTKADLLGDAKANQLFRDFAQYSPKFGTQT